MDIEVLISTMELQDKQKLIQKLHINKSVIINQCKEIKLENVEEGNHKVYSYLEKGLSKSRNRALENSTSQIIIIADDDMKYVEGYEEKIKSAYEKYKDADIIAFYVKNPDKKREKKQRKEGKVNFLESMKIQSVQLTMKRESINNNNIRFNEDYGAGTKWIMGEENIFLFDCLKKGLKVYYVPEQIAELEESESTWFTGFNKEYFFAKGGVYYEMFKKFYFIFALQFAIRKRKLYKENFTIIEAIKFMNEGKRERTKEKTLLKFKEG